VSSLQRVHEDARATADRTAARLRLIEPNVSANANNLAAALKSEWDVQRRGAREAAQTVRHGSGRLGQSRSTVRKAREHLELWSSNWQPYLTAMPADVDHVISFAAGFDDTPRHYNAFDAYARTAAEQAHPEYLTTREAERGASEAEGTAWRELRATEQHYSMALQHYGTLGTVGDPCARLAEVEQAVVNNEAALVSAHDEIVSLRAKPTLRAQRDEIIELAHTRWAIDREQSASWQAVRSAGEHDPALGVKPPDLGWATAPGTHHNRGRGVSR